MYKSLRLLQFAMLIAVSAVAALFVAAVTTPAAGAEGGRVIPAHVDPVFEAACVTAPAMLVYFRSAPNPSAGVFAILKGEQATALLMLTGGGSLAGNDRIIYMFHAPKNPDYSTRMSAYAALADKEGCLLRKDGSRTTVAGAPYVGVTLPVLKACNIFAAIGVDWFRCKDGRPLTDS